MSSTVGYLTAAPVATSAELAEIAIIKALGAAQYEVTVLCGAPKAQLTAITLSAAQADNSYNDAGGAITASTISAAESDNSLNDSGSGFVTAGFQVGQVLTISGFTGDTDNNTAGEAVVYSVTAAKMVLTGVTLADDSAGESVTVTSAGLFLERGFKVGQEIMVRGFTGNIANNIDSGVITALTASKMIIGGTDGDVIVNDSAGESVTICTVESDATYGGTLKSFDYLAGTIPEQYKSGGTPVATVFDPANPPEGPGMASTQAIISHGETVAVKTNGGASSDNATATVAAHACTVALPTTKTVVEHGDTLALTTAGTVTFGVSGGTLSGDIAATTAVVANNATTTVDGKTVTLAVSSRALTGGTIAGTQKIMAHGDTVTGCTGSGTTATLTIVDHVVTIALS